MMYRFARTLSIVLAFTLSCHSFCSIDVHATDYAKVPLLVCLLDSRNVDLKDVAHKLQSALAFSGQFDVSVDQSDGKLSRRAIKQLFQKGYPLAILLDCSSGAINWRLYDTMQAKMVIGKKYAKRGQQAHGWALNIADALWPVLTGQDGFFSTKIAYCKRVVGNNGRLQKHVCVADFDGANEQILVDTPTVNIVPRWNQDKNNPLLFYSEYTNANIRLMSVGMDKKRRIASNFDGINMLAAFSKDGKKVVYCASRGDGNCQLYYHAKGVFKRLAYTDPKTKRSLRQGNNISPTLSEDGDKVYFCSDFLTGRPQIYLYDLNNNAVERLSCGGFCASPTFSHKRECLAYTKKADGVMQLFTYDVKNGKHNQVTCDATNKDECSWSPCGNYIVMSVERAGKSRIAVHSLLTGRLHYLTSAADQCSYPSWSPIYSEFPALRA